MSLNDNKAEKATMENKENAVECGAGCDCKTSGLSTKSKMIVCLVVGLAAAVVLARGFMNKDAAENDDHQDSFATAIPVISANELASPESNTIEDAAKPVLWGDPLNSLATLNTVASEMDAVFVFLPSDNDEQVKVIKEQIEVAADKIISRGTTLSAFILGTNAQEYAQITSQSPAPCVLAMMKGRGMSVVANEITEAKLLQALVEASRPSGCGAGSCGPSGCK